MKARRLALSVASPLVALGIALLITAIVIVISGHDPFEAYGKMLDYNLTKDSVASRNEMLGTNPLRSRDPHSL